MATPKATAWLVGLVVTLFASDVLHGVAAVAENFACTDDAQCGDPTGGNNPHCCYERTAALQQPSNGGKCKASACDGKSNNFKRCSASEACEDSKKCFYQTIESIHGACLDIAEGDEGADKFKIQGCDKPGGCPDATPCCGVGKKCIVNDGAAETKCKCAKPGDCPDNAPCCDTDTCKPIADFPDLTKCKCTDDANCGDTNGEGNAYCCYEPVQKILQSKKDGGKCKPSECDGEIDFRRCVEVPDCKDGNKRHCFSRKDGAASERVYGVCTEKKPTDPAFSDERCRITTDCLTGMSRSCFFRNDTTKPYGKCLSAKDATTGFVNKRDCAKAVDCADPTPCCVPTPKELNSGICKATGDGAPTDVQCGAVTECDQSPDCKENRGGNTKCCIAPNDLKSDIKGQCSDDCSTGGKVERCAAITGCSDQSHKCCVTKDHLDSATGGQCKESCDSSTDSQMCKDNNDCGANKCFFVADDTLKFGVCLSAKDERFKVQSCENPGDCPDDAPCCGGDKKCIVNDGAPQTKCKCAKPGDCPDNAPCCDTDTCKPIASFEDLTKCKCTDDNDCGTAGADGGASKFCCYKKDDADSLQKPEDGGKCKASVCDGTGDFRRCTKVAECTDSGKGHCSVASKELTYGICVAEKQPDFPDERCAKSTDCLTSSDECCATTADLDSATGGLCKDTCDSGTETEICDMSPSCSGHKADPKTSCFYKATGGPPIGVCLKTSGEVQDFTIERECKGKTGCKDETPCCVEGTESTGRQSSKCKDEANIGDQNKDDICIDTTKTCKTSKECKDNNDALLTCCVAKAQFKSDVKGKCSKACATDTVERPCLADGDCEDDTNTNKKCCCNEDGTQLECVANPKSCVTRQNCGTNPTSAPPAPPPAPTPKSGGSVGNLKVLWLASGTLVLAALAHAVWF